MAALLQLTVNEIEHLPNYRKKTAREWSSACPNTGCGGVDRFLFWPDKGNYLCRKCGLKGFVIDGNSPDSLFRVTPEMRAEWERQQIAREIEEHQKQLTTIEQLQARRMDIIYHGQLIETGFDGVLDANWGIKPEMAARFRLGYCNVCPTYGQSDSLTIPYYWGDKLVNLRHRLLHPNGSGKYRPEMAGLQSAIFNATRLLQPTKALVLVEGEFKAVVLEQYGFAAVAIPGANQFKDKWARLFQNAGTVYVILDPGAEEHAAGIGATLARSGVDCRLVIVPEKPDDMFTVYDVTPNEFGQYMRLGKRC